MDCQAKWDVFAECFIRLSAEERCRFVDYGKVEVELVREMAEDEGDTLDGGASSENKRAAVPKILLDEQVQIMSLIESQIDALKQSLQEKLTES